MEYTDTICYPYHQDIDKLYKVEKKAARFIANGYKYDTGSIRQIFKHWGDMP